MTQPLQSVSESETARLVAPVIDALRGAIASSVQADARIPELMGRLGLPPEGIQVFVLLRNTLSGRSVSRDGMRATVRYIPDHQFESSMHSLSHSGLVTMTDESLSLTQKGQDFTAEMVAAARRWSPRCGGTGMRTPCSSAS